ncbi:hypothetical protein ACIGW4_37715 [Streptomyces sp. NPDC053513]|uniref:Uncharacterized protein n=1 Tax=Streptomyces litmocidini TaxID=67318 RepID=A0ABW7UIB2_9ACTN
MTGVQAFTTGTAALLDLDPYRFPAALIDDAPERTPSVCGRVEPGDRLLPAPEPASRLTTPLEPTDRRRLELHAALTAAGIAPLPGDLDAIEALCQLTDTTHIALRRWINRAV